MIKMGTVVGTCMPETEHHQTTHLTSTIAPIRRRRYGKIELTPFYWTELMLPCESQCLSRHPVAFIKAQ